MIATETTCVVLLNPGPLNRSVDSVFSCPLRDNMASQSERAVLAEIANFAPDAKRKRDRPDYKVLTSPDPDSILPPLAKRVCTFSASEERDYAILARNLSPDRSTVREKTIVLAFTFSDFFVFVSPVH